MSPVLLAYTAWQASKAGGKRYLLQRLGWYSPQADRDITEPQIWIHAASVGEVLTVLPLLKAVTTPLLLTTTTPTGAQVLSKQGLTHVQHAYLPVDLPGACQRFFKQHRIASAWVVETEIWPWLYACAHQQGIALTIINARLSDRTSVQAQGLLASTYKRALRDVRILARSSTDADRFMALGATCATTVGNLKYAKPDTQLNSGEPLLERPYVLAASTHDDEERQLADAWLNSSSHNSASPLLVIVPRHPKRGAVISQQLEALGMAVSVRSRQDAVGPQTQIVLADTLGELHAWYSHAIACFVGGSLVDRGGHNILEAARCECPIIVGPHTSNFDDIVQPMLTKQALIKADTAAQVVAFFHQLVSVPDDSRAMVSRASALADAHSDVAEHYLRLLLPALPTECG